MAGNSFPMSTNPQMQKIANLAERDPKLFLILSTYAASDKAEPLDKLLNKGGYPPEKVREILGRDNSPAQVVERIAHSVGLSRSSRPDVDLADSDRLTRGQNKGFMERLTRAVGESLDDSCPAWLKKAAGPVAHALSGKASAVLALGTLAAGVSNASTPAQKLEVIKQAAAELVESTVDPTGLMGGLAAKQGTGMNYSAVAKRLKAECSTMETEMFAQDNRYPLSAVEYKGKPVTAETLRDPSARNAIKEQLKASVEGTTDPDTRTALQAMHNQVNGYDKRMDKIAEIAAGQSSGPAQTTASPQVTRPREVAMAAM